MRADRRVEVSQSESHLHQEKTEISCDLCPQYPGRADHNAERKCNVAMVLLPRLTMLHTFSPAASTNSYFYFYTATLAEQEENFTFHSSVFCLLGAVF